MDTRAASALVNRWIQVQPHHLGHAIEAAIQRPISVSDVLDFESLGSQNQPRRGVRCATPGECSHNVSEHESTQTDEEH